MPPLLLASVSPAIIKLIKPHSSFVFSNSQQASCQPPLVLSSFSSLLQAFSSPLPHVAAVPQAQLAYTQNIRDCHHSTIDTGQLLHADKIIDMAHNLRSSSSCFLLLSSSSCFFLSLSISSCSLRSLAASSSLRRLSRSYNIVTNNDIILFNQRFASPHLFFLQLPHLLSLLLLHSLLLVSRL